MTDIDKQSLDELKRAVGDAFSLIIDKYKENSMELMAAIEDGINSGDHGKTEINAHSLKSSSAQVGAKLLSEIAGKIEHAPAENKAELETLLLEAKEAHKAVIQFFNE